MRDKNEISFMAISGLSFPHRSPPYFIGLVKDLVEHHEAKFIISAGHTIAGRALERQIAEYTRKIRDPRKKLDILQSLTKEVAGAFDEFLPMIKEVNWHIVVAERIYDRPIGLRILEQVQSLRRDRGNDIRLLLDGETGRSDPQPKVPIELSGFGDMRVVVPYREPWFYENVTGLMQRLVNSFAGRTHSPVIPPLLVAGCVGVGAFIPSYKGVPSVAVPVCYKLDEQRSTENMIGCVLIRIVPLTKGKFRIVPKIYDFRTIVSKEKTLSFPADLSKCHKLAMESLQTSSASQGTVQFRVNTIVKNPWPLEKTKRILDQLCQRKLAVYNPKSNRFAISAGIVAKTKIPLEEFFKGKRVLTTIDESCRHFGCLKTLYHTIGRLEPELAADLNVDAIVFNGDGQQGISHNYEYNGELVPIFNGVDKQQIGLALMQINILMNVFKNRWAVLKKQNLPILQLIDKCLVTFVYKYGNHDEPRFSKSKDAIPLVLFDEKLRAGLLDAIMRFLSNEKCLDKEVTYDVIRPLVNQKIVRVGESRVAKIAGVPTGIKHPYKSRTKSRGQRIQEVGEFFMNAMTGWPDNDLRHIVVVKVANFHENAVVFRGIFGRTIFGVMTASGVKDTLFESNQDKIVEHGLAKVTIELTPSNQIISGEVEFHDEIDEEDRKIVFNDELTNRDISDLCLRLSEKYNMPWR
jgi:hypothetical protein